MAGDTPIVLDAPGLAKLVGQLAALLKSDQSLRELQSRNALQASNFDQPGVTGNPGIWGSFGGNVAITGNVHYVIPEARNDQKYFSLLALTFETGSGSGRYRIDGPPASPTIGTQVPPAGIVILVPGMDAIKKFDLVAEAGQTLVFSRYLFI
jgi:hypothetical protein